jgi:hypothetical protein
MLVVGWGAASARRRRAAELGSTHRRPGIVAAAPDRGARYTWSRAKTLGQSALVHPELGGLLLYVAPRARTRSTTSASRERELRTAQLESSLRKLAALRRNSNRTFSSNALNSVSALMYRDVDAPTHAGAHR